LETFLSNHFCDEKNTSIFDVSTSFAVSKYDKKKLGYGQEHKLPLFRCAKEYNSSSPNKTKEDFHLYNISKGYYVKATSLLKFY